MKNDDDDATLNDDDANLNDDDATEDETTLVDPVNVDSVKEPVTKPSRNKGGEFNIQRR